MTTENASVGPDGAVAEAELQPVPRSQQERVLATLPLAVVTTSSDGLVLFMNGEAARILGSAAQASLGSPLWSLFGDAYETAVKDDVDMLVSQWTSVERTVELVAGAGGGSRTLTIWGSITRFGHDSMLTWMLYPHPPASRPTALASLPRALVTIAGLPSLCSGADEVTTRASEVCQHALGEDVSVSLMLGSPRTPAVISSTSQLGQAVDGAQIIADEGPCLQAHDTGELIVSADLIRDDRWPHLQERVVGLAVGGVVAYPVSAGGERIGAFNVFTAPDVAPDPEMVEATELLGEALGSALVEVGLRTELETSADDLRAALMSRAVIDQAKGIIMADKKCTADEAFAHLRELSSRSHVKVRDVAAALVDMTAAKR